MTTGGGQQRIDWFLVPGLQNTIALQKLDGTEWGSAPVALFGPLDAPLLPNRTATLSGASALFTLSEASIDTLLLGFPVGGDDAPLWHVQHGGEPFSTGVLLWDTTGQGGPDKAIPVVAGPEGPTAVSTDPGNVAELGTDGLIFVSPTAGSAHVIQDEGAALTNRAALNFVGTGVTATDDAGNGATLVTITAGAVASVNGETGAVSLSAADVGAEPAKGADDNYVTDAEKTKLSNLSGTNTGDQTLPTWSTIAGKPAVVAEGATAADARTQIGAGTSSFSGAYTDLSGKPTLGDAAAKDTGTTTGTVAAGDHNHTGVYAPASHNHAASDIASGTVATARLGSGTADSTTMLGGDQAYRSPHAVAQSINAQTGTTYTLVASDAGKLVTCSNAAAITVTLPQDSDAAFAVGTRVDVAVLGAGMVTFTAGTGATVNGTPSLVTRAQYSAVTCIKRAANTWLVVGDLA